MSATDSASKEHRRYKGHVDGTAVLDTPTPAPPPPLLPPAQRRLRSHATLRERLADLEAQKDLALSTDVASPD